MASSKMRVEFLYDREADNWGFMVPALRVAGGGCASRKEAEKHATDAIKFALTDETGAETAPEVEASYAEVTVSMPIRSTQGQSATG